MLKRYKKIWFLLNKQEKKKSLLLLSLMIITAFLEVIGIGSVMPFLAVLGNPETVETNHYLAFMYKYLNFNEVKVFLMFLGSIAISLLLLSASFKTFTYYTLYRFANLRRYSFSKKLFTKYLHQPYSFFLSKNSSVISKNILSEVDLVITQTIIPSLMLITYSVILIFLVIFLLLVDPILSFILISLFGGFYTMVYVSIRKYLLKMGKKREKANSERFQIISETIGGIKDLKVLGREKVYLDGFSKPSYDFSFYNSVAQTLTSVPQFLLEVIAFGSILVMAMYSLNKEGMNLGDLLPVLGLYTLAALKLKPAANQIYSALSAMKFGASSLDLMMKELKDLQEEDMSIENDNKRLKLKSELILSNVNFSYESSKRILENININIKANTTIGIVGKTGSGKSTLIDLILGLLPPENGDVLIDGTSLTKENIRSWQNSIGYVPQSIFLSDGTITSNIAFGVPKNKIDSTKIELVSKMAQVDDFIMTLEKGYDTEIGERGIRLSGGQRQRLGIARALYHDPDLLLLDEATSALDNKTETDIMESINKMHGSRTIIMIAHRLNTLEKCDVIIKLDNGCIVKSEIIP